VEGLIDLALAAEAAAIVADVLDGVFNGTQDGSSETDSLKRLIINLRTWITAAVATASQATSIASQITALNNLSALANIFGPTVLEIPDSGSTDFGFTITVKDAEGKLVNLDASPTVTATNAAGTDRSVNLSAIANPATGRYTFTYTVADDATAEGLRIEGNGTVSGEARYVVWQGAVADYDTATAIAAMQAKIDTLHDTRIPGVVQPQTGDSFAVVSHATHGNAAIETASTAAAASAASADGKLNAAFETLVSENTGNKTIDDLTTPKNVTIDIDD
jgi:hypothetical protein